MPRTPRRRPSLEALENRNLPAVFGIPWPDPGHLTLSFVPDGTSVDGAASTLNATLDAQLPDSVWKLDVIRAFQSWAAVANINLTVVNDDGEAFGTPGPLQGNADVGDIRIAAAPLSSDELAISTPFDLGGTGAGDVILNSNVTFSQGGANDLYSVVVHEAGHVFGLDNDPYDLNSVLDPVLSAVRTGLDDNDVAEIQALYGARQGTGDNTLATATPLGFASLGNLAGAFPPSSSSVGNLYGTDPGSATIKWAVAADLSGPTDLDDYSVQAPTCGGPLTAALHADGISLLTARVTIINANGQPLASAQAANPLNNDVLVSIPATTPGATYYIQVAGKGSSVFDAGAYRLSVGAPSIAPGLANPPIPLSSLVPAAPKGIGFNTAVPLAPIVPGTDARWQYVVQNSLVQPGETDDYAVTAPPANGPRVLLATVWGTTQDGLTPQVTVFDAHHNVVPAQLIHADASSLSLQIPNAVPSALYVIEVAARNLYGFSPNSLGGYELAATFGNVVVPTDTFATGTITAAQPDGFQTLVVSSTAMTQFDLSAASASSNGDDAVRMTVYNSNLSPVFGLDAIAGADPVSGDVLLSPGTYVVRFTAVTRTGAPAPATTYTLNGLARSDPIGPTPTDPTLIPADDTTDPVPVLPTSDTLPDTSDYLDLTDIISNPWM